MRTALLSLLILAGCAAPGTPHSAAGPLRGDGFTLAPPAGAGWVVGSELPARIVFTRRTGELAPYQLTAGAETVADAHLAASLQAGESGAARAWLAQRLRAPRRENLRLDVRTAALHGARCAAYDALQADRYDPEHILPDHVDDRSQYAQHGLLCAHPRSAGRVVQVFYNERFLRDGAPARHVGEGEVWIFFDGARWDEPRRN